MPLFEQTIPINHEDIAKSVLEHWGITLGPVIKESQNHTFNASLTLDDDTEEKYIVRVTPDPKGVHFSRIVQEIAFVSYLSDVEQIKYIAGPLPAKTTGEKLLKSGDLVIVVSRYARGEAIGYFDRRWMYDQKLIHTVGKWFALSHQASRRYSEKHSEEAAKV